MRYKIVSKAAKLFLSRYKIVSKAGFRKSAFFHIFEKPSISQPITLQIFTPMNPTRRNALKNVASVVGAATLSPFAFAENTNPENIENMALKGNINHSVCRWCYEQIPLEQFCQAVADMGLKAIDLIGENDWATLKKYGLTCSMANGAEISLTKGFNDPANHDELERRYKALIPKVAANGLKNLICFSGNRAGMNDWDGLENSVQGLKRILPLAEEKGVVLQIELFNSKVDHKDYMGDSMYWGVELCRRLGSPSFKILYDIYHMQIQEGDIIRSIRKYKDHIGHVHTGGNPGRNEIDETQEIYYPAIMKALVDMGYKGYVAQEFIPKSGNPLASLQKCVGICDV
jgi:hydroxypyruvate isomerase